MCIIYIIIRPGTLWDRLTIYPLDLIQDHHTSGEENDWDWSKSAICWFRNLASGTSASTINLTVPLESLESHESQPNWLFYSRIMHHSSRCLPRNSLSSAYTSIHLPFPNPLRHIFKPALVLEDFIADACKWVGFIVALFRLLAVRGWVVACRLRTFGTTFLLKM